MRAPVVSLSAFLISGVLALPPPYLQTAAEEHTKLSVAGLSTTSDHCAQCKTMVRKAKQAWLDDHTSRGSTDAQKLVTFKTDLMRELVQKCMTALGDAAECGHCETCVAGADVADMNAFLGMSDAALCNSITGANVCGVAKDESSDEEDDKALLQLIAKSESALAKHREYISLQEVAALGWDTC